MKGVHMERSETMSKKDESGRCHKIGTERQMKRVKTLNEMYGNFTVMAILMKGASKRNSKGRQHTYHKSNLALNFVQ